jgi:signal transduction histidine kinase/CheY-like chemotaxis protein
VSPHEEPVEVSPDALYENAACGLLLTAHDGAILRANRTFRSWVDHEAADLRGRRFQDLLTIGGRIFHQTHLQPLLQMQGSVSEVKLGLRRREGGDLPIVVNAVRRCVGGTWFDEFAVFVAKDRHTYEHELLQARRRAEELAARQQQAQEELRLADQRKDEFLAMLAHELRNPLAPIATAAHLLQAAADETPQLRQIATIIQRQASHLTHLVDDLLDVSRVTRGLIQLERAVVDPADVVEAALEQSRGLITARRHALHVDVPRGAAIEADRTRLVQVLANLLNNAAKYTPQGGEIRVVLERADGEVGMSVRDTGMGIHPELRPHLFDLFSQGERTPDRSQGGLGIGLALVRSLVDLHGGRIDVHSDGPQCGSRFTVWLPRVAAEPARPVPASPALQAPVRLRVLVVDDNADAVAMLCEVLEMCGHAAIAAATAAEALALADGAFDAGILDIGLPDMTGYELATTLRRRGASGLLVALTGYGQPQDRVLSRAAGFDHHMVKPVDIDALVRILAAVRPRSETRAPA